MPRKIHERTEEVFNANTELCLYFLFEKKILKKICKKL